jgi:hypothetical protein
MSLRVRRTLGQMLDQGHTAMAECATCRGHHDIDLAQLIAKVGRDYSLWNRRSALPADRGLHRLDGIPMWAGVATPDGRRGDRMAVVSQFLDASALSTLAAKACT